MRQFAISVLSLLVALPAFADARLPVVNLAAGGVSARAAFGEPVAKPDVDVSVEPIRFAENNDAIVPEPVVARASDATRTVSGKNSVIDGGQIIASNNVLTPRRPSADLWARADVDAPLRLPTPDEFSVIKSDFELPEESLMASPLNTRSATVARASGVNSEPVSETGIDMDVRQRLSELDAQIARLNELQRRADASVSEQPLTAAQEIEPVKTARAASETPARRVVARRSAAPAVKPVEPKIVQSDASDNNVNLSRMVVPMADDVVVRAVEKSESPRIASVRNDMTQLSPSELRKAFRKTFLSENKHLSTFQIDDRFDVASDMTENAAGFTSARDLSEAGGIRPLEIKIKFRNSDSALSRDNYNLLTEYAGIVLSNPTRAVQVSIPESATHNDDDRKLAARRLAIVEQVLRDNGISEQRILPVLSQRDDEGLVLRMISLDQYETLTQQKRDMFGDTVSKKTYRSMSW